MKCPKCSNFDTKVLDSRVVQDGNAIRRRRECEYCEHRFTTFERRGITDLVVLKKDGTRELYDRTKITRALLLAYAKRNIAMDKLEEIISGLEVNRSGENEIPSEKIGADILAALKAEDPVAYIRFASVYMNFNSREDFQHLMGKGK
ncbi:MAG: transcriptional regulator NrdR [bacterium]